MEIASCGQLQSLLCTEVIEESVEYEEANNSVLVEGNAVQQSSETGINAMCIVAILTDALSSSYY